MTGVRPRKRFGQHFLVDRMVVEAIVAAIAPRPDEHLVEIGPGTAALTVPLLARIGDMDAVEIDRDLAAGLRRRFGGRLRLHEADVLAFDFAALADERAGQRPGPAGQAVLRLVGNLPYNISSPLLLRLLGFADRIIDQHFMLQKEVVARIVAEPGGDMGRLTVLLQAWYEVETLMQVPPEAFDPPPKVESSVIRMLPRPQPLTRNRAGLQALLAAGFGQRRKMLRQSLKSLGVDAEGLCRVVGIDPTARAEVLTIEQFCALANAIDQKLV